MVKKLSPIEKPKTSSALKNICWICFKTFLNSNRYDQFAGKTHLSGLGNHPALHNYNFADSIHQSERYQADPKESGKRKLCFPLLKWFLRLATFVQILLDDLQLFQSR